jgi:hypothetical protein
VENGKFLPQQQKTPKKTAKKKINKAQPPPRRKPFASQATTPSYKGHQIDFEGHSRPLLPDSTKFLQVIDKAVNGPYKRELRSRHGEMLVQIMVAFLEEHPPPSAALEDPELAMNWILPAYLNLDARTRAVVIAWADEVLRCYQKSWARMPTRCWC